MASTFGDYLDYTCDIIKLVALLVALHYVNPKLFRQTLPITIILLILLLGHGSCHDDALPVFKKVCALVQMLFTTPDSLELGRSLCTSVY